jgi:hypothetical protein
MNECHFSYQKKFLKKQWIETPPIHGTLVSSVNRIYLPRIMNQQLYTKGLGQPKRRLIVKPMCPQNGFNVDFLKLELLFEPFWFLYVKKCNVKGQWNNEGVFLLCSTCVDS